MLSQDPSTGSKFEVYEKVPISTKISASCVLILAEVQEKNKKSILINLLSTAIKYTSLNLPESTANPQHWVPKMQGQSLGFGMCKHLVEEIVTSEKVQTEQPVCLCGWFLAGEPPGSMERLECPPWVVPVIQKDQNKDFPIYSRATESKSTGVMKRHSLPLSRLLKGTQTMAYQRAERKRVLLGGK